MNNLHNKQPAISFKLVTLNLVTRLGKSWRLLLPVFCIMWLPLTGCGAKKASAENVIAAARTIEREQDRNSVVNALLDFAEVGALETYFERSYGLAVFPTIGRGGMGIGGARGSGFVFRRGELTGQTTMTQVTIGFQLGGQAFSQIIFFENEAAYNNFTSGNFELGAQASAVALTIGASAQADTAGGASAGAGRAQAKRDFTNGMAIFTLIRGGLMYEASVGGQKFTFRPIVRD